MNFSFRPKLLDTLPGYDRGRFSGDLSAGLTVGVLALPLAMAFAIASGMSPTAGIWTAIVAGFLISALGGSRVQIGGPTGAFIPIIYAIVADYGVQNLLIATMMSGVMLLAMGAFRLGSMIRFIPLSVVIGFTNGIAVLIALSQVRDLLGLDIAKMPADFFSQIGAIASHMSSLNFHALGLGIVCVIGLFIWPRLWAVDSQFRRQLDKIETVSALKATSRIPAPVVALVTLSLLAWALGLPVETIGSRFGGFMDDSSRLIGVDVNDVSVLGLEDNPALADEVRAAAMIEGGIPHMLEVRRYLDAVRCDSGGVVAVDWQSADPAVQGAPGFSEYFYLTQYPEVAAAVTARAAGDARR
mgnify:CR=1 FL=1